jgi:hypothetical protein
MGMATLAGVRRSLLGNHHAATPHTSQRTTLHLNSATPAHALVYGCEITTEIVDALSRPKLAENENLELVDRDDEILFSKERGPPQAWQGNSPDAVASGPYRPIPETRTTPLIQE